MKGNDEQIVRDDGFVALRKEPEEKTSENPNKRVINNIETHESFEPDILTLEDAQEIITDMKKNSQKKITYIQKVLGEKGSYRKLFISIIETNPSRYGEIEPLVYTTKNTTYRNLYKLIELGLIKKIPVMKVIEKKIELDEDEKEVLRKFNIWIERMTDRQQGYYKGCTNYWVLTPLGKNPILMSWSIKNEKLNYEEKEK